MNGGGGGGGGGGGWIWLIINQKVLLKHLELLTSFKAKVCSNRLHH